MSVCYNCRMSKEEKGSGRSGCPVNFTLEIFGDKWSLLIVRDIIFLGKKTYGEFLKSDERIATNILSNKLARLEATGILSKNLHPTDKRKDIYSLTDKGCDLIPIILEMFSWGATYNLQEKSESVSSAQQANHCFLEQYRRDKQKTIEQIKDTVRNGGFIFSSEED